MERRAFLAGLAGAALSASAGCSSRRSAAPRTPPPADRDVGTVAGVPLPVPETDLRMGALRDSIPAIVDPAFGADWAGLEFEYKVAGEVGTSGTIEPRLRPDDQVVGVVRGGAARAYPLRVLDYHEVVNDCFDGPLLVTFCPLCGSGVTADRRVAGATTRFGVSGWLWNSALVMYDGATESLWSQVAATAIRGPRTGDRLSLVPSTLTSWDAWREAHPGTEVLLPPPASDTVRGLVAFDYTTDPYHDYERTRRMGIGQNRVPDHGADLHPKAQVLGIEVDGAARAYPLAAVRSAGVVNDEVGGLPVVVTVGPDGRTLHGYVRRVGDEVLHFAAESPSRLRAAGSRWDPTTGRAVDGPLRGTTLAPASAATQLFWFAWLDFHPRTTVFAG